ncbi:stress response protein [Candidatus Poriferisocius sp.]|uniref:stress response protein n=1 Tax=Candidatus Poriferisocius sp. TaxID=3101276 RepID=UPI003B5966BE
MAETEFERARLIPVAGIKGAKEAEDRATSALLSVMSVVPSLSRALLVPLGCTSAKKAKISTFVKPGYRTGDGRLVIPDGLIRVEVGQRTGFEALVEVKTGMNKLSADQLNEYLEVARGEGIDCVITISNEIAPSPGVHPTDGLKVRSNSRTQVHHLSWSLILAEAVKEHSHRGVDDPEQAWIVDELIRYLTHEKSGVVDFSDMGDNWNAVLEAATDGSLSRRSPEAAEICQRWDQLLRFATLKLGAEIGADVTEVIPRAHRQNPQARNKEFVASLCSEGSLSGVLRVPDGAADLSVSVDLKARKITVSTQLAAPDDRTPRAAVVWLVKQMKDAPNTVLIDVYQKSGRIPVTSSLELLREDPKTGLPESKQPPNKFLVRQQTKMGTGRRSTRKKGFIDSVVDAVIDFYANVFQDLQAFVPRAPSLERHNKTEMRTSSTSGQNEPVGALSVRQESSPG